MKYFLYARKSSDREDKQIASLESQITVMTELADSLDLEIVDVLRESKSAKYPDNRLIFSQMLRRIEKGEADGILCWQINRLSRNPKENGLIQQMLADEKIKSIRTMEKEYLSEDNQILYSVEGAMASQYSRDLSKNVKRGVTTKMTKGQLPRQAPLGYMNAGNPGDRYQVIDEKVAPYVRRMFRLYADGNSAKKIKVILYNEGFRGRKGKMVSTSMIERYLRNPFYVGKIAIRGQIIKGSQKPLIPEKLFEQVQNLYQHKSEPKTLFQKHVYLFKGWAKCTQCLKFYVWEAHKGHVYGRCFVCKAVPFVRQEVIEAGLLKYINDVTIHDPDLLQWIKDNRKSKHQSEIEYYEQNKTDLDRQLAVAHKRLERLYDDKADGKVTEVFYEQNFNRYTEQIKELEGNIKKVEQRKSKHYEVGNAILDLSHNALRVWAKAEQETDPIKAIERKRKLMRLVFSNPMTFDRITNELRANYKKEFQAIVTANKIQKAILEPRKTNIYSPNRSKMAEIANWRDRRGSNP